MRHRQLAYIPSLVTKRDKQMILFEMFVKEKCLIFGGDTDLTLYFEKQHISEYYFLNYTFLKNLKMNNFLGRILLK